MEKDTSKSVQHFAVAAFFVAATCVLVWQMFGPSWFKNIRAEVTSQPYARTISVSGEGKISAKPDIANVSLAVVAKGSTVKQVTNDGNVKMNQVLAAVKNLGVDAKDITTSQYNLYPDYNYLTNGGNKIIGYNLTQEITVKVRDLTKVDEILDGGTKAGANQVGSLTFDIDDTGAVKKQAREKAFAAAREKAQEMAAAAGVKLGRVVTFSEDAAPVAYPMMNFAMEAKSSDAAGGAPSVEPGSKELSISVSVTYEIE